MHFPTNGVENKTARGNRNILNTALSFFSWTNSLFEWVFCRSSNVNRNLQFFFWLWKNNLNITGYKGGKGKWYFLNFQHTNSSYLMEHLSGGNFSMWQLLKQSSVNEAKISTTRLRTCHDLICAGYISSDKKEENKTASVET